MPPPLLPALCAALFALVTWQVVADGPLRGMDERLGRSLAGAGDSSDVTRSLTESFADLGHLHVALPVLAMALFGATLLGRTAGAPRWWLPPLASALAAAAVPALVVPLKAWTARPGPADPSGPAGRIADGEGFFPSGHAATAAVAYGAAAVLLLPYVRRTLGRRLLTVGVPLLNLGVGASLVERGYHWPLDVLGSWCLAGLLLWAVSRPRPGPARSPLPPRASPVPAPSDR